MGEKKREKLTLTFLKKRLYKSSQRRGHFGRNDTVSSYRGAVKRKNC